MNTFDYVSAKTLSDALSTDSINRQWLAGGTDLLTLLKHNLYKPRHLVDIKRISALDGDVRPTEQGVSIGALTTLTTLASDSLICQRYPALAEAAGSAATVQIRNRATLAGNLLQRPRCGYFRNPDIQCWLKDGTDCPAETGHNSYHALYGDSQCRAVHPSDLAAALMVYRADVQIVGPAGVRIAPLTEFYRLPEPDRRQEALLSADELIVAITLPSLPTGICSTYLKAMDRKAWAFALVGVAALVQVEQNRFSELRLVLSGVAAVPWQAVELEQQLLGERFDSTVIDTAIESYLQTARPLSGNGYKIALLRGLLRQVLIGRT